MDDIKVDTPKSVALEQEETAVINLGRMIGVYYASLREAGITKALAYNLVMDFQGFKLSRYDTDNA